MKYLLGIGLFLILSFSRVNGQNVHLDLSMNPSRITITSKQQGVMIKYKTTTQYTANMIMSDANNALEMYGFTWGKVTAVKPTSSTEGTILLRVLENKTGEDRELIFY